MNVVKIILGIIFLIDCIALTVVVLMQEGKQQGLALLQVRQRHTGARTKDVLWEGGLVKATTIMGSFIFQ